MRCSRSGAASATTAAPATCIAARRWWWRSTAAPSRTAQQLARAAGHRPSTAAAIAAFCFDERVAILDGNVKRVLSRVLAFDGDLAQAVPQRQLWECATRLLPPPELREGTAPSAMASYTQGLMDLGAGICSLRAPACLICPVQDRCRGAAGGEPQRYPVKTRKQKRSSPRNALADAGLARPAVAGAATIERASGPACGACANSPMHQRWSKPPPHGLAIRAPCSRSCTC